MYLMSPISKDVRNISRRRDGVGDSAYCLPLVATLAIVAARLARAWGVISPVERWLRHHLFSLISRGFCGFAGGVFNMCQ